MPPDAPRPAAGPVPALSSGARTSAGTAAVACMLAALAAAGPSDGAAAQQPLAFELRAGAGLPAFDLADRADPGFAFGLDLSYRVADRVSVVAGGDGAVSGPAGADALWSFPVTGGVRLHF